MRSFYVLLLILLAGCGSRTDSHSTSSGVEPVSTPTTKAEPAAPKFEVEITDELLSIQGKKVTMPISADDLSKIIGTPHRNTRDTNPKVIPFAVWDDLGISGNMGESGEGFGKKVVELRIILVKGPYDAPKTAFAGRLVLDGRELTSATTIDQINASRTGAKFVKGSEDFHWKLEGKKSYVFIRTSKEPEKGIEQMTISPK